MKNTIEGNLETWDKEHHWSRDGDEWDGQAQFSGVTYEDWKNALVETFILPNVNPDSSVLEIAPGHGRWSEIIAGRCQALTLVDLSPSCIEFCRNRLSDYHHVQYHVTDGKSLSEVPDSSIDFLWSFDSFVHMSPEVIQAYLREAHRVLRPGGKAILHHAGRKNGMLWLGFLKDWGEIGRNIYKVLSMGKVGDDDGWRSDVSGPLVRQLAENSGLQVEDQVQKWGEGEKFGVHRYGDWMTTLRKG
jgi:ubiquinone/menaquinone biosynthesis C-methylase UbiE